MAVSLTDLDIEIFQRLGAARDDFVSLWGTVKVPAANDKHF